MSNHRYLTVGIEDIKYTMLYTLDTCLDDRRGHLRGRDIKISMALYAIRVIPLTTDFDPIREALFRAVYRSFATP